MKCLDRDNRKEKGNRQNEFAQVRTMGSQFGYPLASALFPRIFVGMWEFGRDVYRGYIGIMGKNMETTI